MALVPAMEARPDGARRPAAAPRPSAAVTGRRSRPPARARAPDPARAHRPGRRSWPMARPPRRPPATPRRRRRARRVAAEGARPWASHRPAPVRRPPSPSHRPAHCCSRVIASSVPQPSARLTRSSAEPPSPHPGHRHRGRAPVDTSIGGDAGAPRWAGDGHGCPAPSTSVRQRPEIDAGQRRHPRRGDGRRRGSHARDVCPSDRRSEGTNSVMDGRHPRHGRAPRHAGSDGSGSGHDTDHE